MLQEGLLQSTGIPSRSLQDDQAFQRKGIALKDGYTFAGWFKDKDLEDVISKDSKVSDMYTHTLYAKWTANTYNGVLTLMAGLSPKYELYKDVIKQQHEDLRSLFGNPNPKMAIEAIRDRYEDAIKSSARKKQFNRMRALQTERNKKIEACKNKILILEDPFIGDDSIIIVLIDRLLPDESWKHLSKRKIDANNLRSFVLGGYSWETVKDENGRDKQIKVSHNASAPFFAVMCNWGERSLNVDGIQRKMVIGSIFALGRQIDYFLEDDLHQCRDSEVDKLWKESRRMINGFG